MRETTQPAVPDHVPAELVYDFAADDPLQEVATEPFAMFERWRAQAPGIFYLKEIVEPLPGADGGGGWVVQSAELMREVFQEGVMFSNRVAGGGGQSARPRKLIPLELDPPEHGKYRRLLAKEFSPRLVNDLEESLTKRSEKIIQGFASRGSVEFMEEYARVFPIIVLMELVGFPVERREEFSEWERLMFQGETIERRAKAGANVAAMIKQLVEDKRKKPGEDLLSRLVTSEIDGQPIDQDKLEDMGFLLFLAGLDTVTGGLGHIFRFLAENAKEQQLLRDQPELIPNAIEELLRYHSWISTGRVLSRDAVFHGLQMKAGDRIMCATYCASNDPGLISAPREFDLCRAPNPHFAFGAGVHRCAGSHLARRELRIAVTQMLEHIPTFRLQDGAKLRYDGGLVCLGALPLEWDV